jgi:hypothetical protein
MKSTRSFRLLVFFSAFACLMFELIITRLADFHLDARNSFLALPITFFGLALGSLHVHFRHRIIERFSVRRSLLLLAAVSYATLLLIYLLFTQYLPVIAAASCPDHLNALFWKTLIFAIVFMIPFYVFGRILTVCYFLCRDQIGLIYSADFFGAALGCFVTPILFHFVSLPEITTLFLGVLGLVVAVRFHRTRVRTAIFIVGLTALVAGSYFVIYRLEHSVHLLDAEGQNGAPVVREVTSRWNEFSRVQLLHVQPPGSRADYYTIVHDNGRSYVNVNPYVPGKTGQVTYLDAMELPFILGKPTDDIMIMFAGCGSEMIRYNEYTGGKSHIVGVELNGLCKTIARDTPELADFRLREFYQLPNIDLRIEEGRSFLMRNTRRYDAIFIGSSATTWIAVTGHTRKFLYTVEAFNLYLDALKPGGLLLFDHQPLFKNLDTLKVAFGQRGIKNFPECVILFRSTHGRPTGNPDVAVCPQGFTPSDVQKVLHASASAPKQVCYAPFLDKPPEKSLADEICSAIDPSVKHVTDDRPYVLELDLGHYKLWPSKQDFTDGVYYASWIKITTLIVLCAAAAVFIVLASLSRTRRLPPSILVYLLITGFCYLLVEVAYIAKLELFLQNLLISMACVISIFLLTSGIGSLTYLRVAGRFGMRVFPVIVAAVVYGSIAALEFALHHLLGLPLAAKLIAAGVLIAPAGIALGMFYPYAVHCLVRHERENAVAITYGISTLSSVIGATYAMTFMLRGGFNMLLVQAAAGYALLGLLVTGYALISRKNLLVP